ncbi:Cuticle protein 10.9 like protein [Argiope bruennichi]|uniref:Cuticle protein 10.9 like protein n=1 Tax=Argiope bruennichi TaxID=94029 RepID=A0A8T0EHN9_ARGBR|nr:Cuticle protein 10.9 like protein [Argiope bruennichi]
MFLVALLACISLVHGSVPLVHGSIPLAHGLVHNHARPYQAGYYIRHPHRHEHAEIARDHSGAVAGRYGYLDARGIGKQVHYVADHAGLRARVHTNEPAVVHNAPVAAGVVSGGLLAPAAAGVVSGGLLAPAAARVVSGGLLAPAVVPVPAYTNLAPGHDFRVDGYGLGYSYRNPLGYSNILPHAQPYNFGYAIRDHTSDQYRQEKGNGLGGVVGSYGFKDARGIVRNVNYVADHAGFRAQVNTNEPGTANQNPAAVLVNSHQPVVVKADEPVRPLPVVAAPAALGDYRFGPGLADALGYYGGVNFAVPLIGGAVRG